jgi:hypothetical protein
MSVTRNALQKSSTGFSMLSRGRACCLRGDHDAISNVAKNFLRLASNNENSSLTVGKIIFCDFRHITGPEKLLAPQIAL